MIKVVQEAVAVAAAAAVAAAFTVVAALGANITYIYINTNRL